MKRTFYIVTFLLFAANFCAQAQFDRKQQLEQKRRELISQIERINKLRQTNKKEEKNVLNQVEDLNSKIAVRENLIKVTNSQVNLLTQDINENTNKISSLRKELEKLKEDYAAMVRKSYKSKSSQSRIMFLLSSENFLQAYKRIQYMKQYSDYRKEQGEDIKDRTILLQETNRKLLDQKKDKEKLIAENRVAREKLKTEKEQQDKLMEIIRGKESTYASQIRDKQREADKIDKEIDKLIREAIAASNKKVSGGNKEIENMKTFALTPEAKALATNFISNKGKLPWPVETGTVIKKFGTSRHPTLPNITTYNSGVEIQTDPGSMARAAFNGTVFQIQVIKGGGYAVLIRHGNYLTVYQNLKSLKVKVGQDVSIKQEIGEVAVNPFNGKTILKFLVFKDAERQNPADWVFNM